jgi:hypothetical protein
MAACSAISPSSTILCHGIYIYAVVEGLQGDLAVPSVLGHELRNLRWLRFFEQNLPGVVKRELLGAARES